MAKFFVGFIIFAYSPIRNPDMQEVMLTIGWADLKSFLSVGYILFVIVTIAVIIHDKREPVKALSWIIVISLLPVVGFVFYIVFGRNHRKQKLFNRKELHDLEQIDALSRQQIYEINHPSLLHKSEISDHRDTITLLLNSNKALLTVHNRVRVLNDGAETFDEIRRALRQARESIHMEYYIIEDDELGREIADILIAKAAEGVEVRLIYDDFGCMFTLPRTYNDQMAARGIQCRVFNRFVPIMSLRLNNRDHRKLMIIDGKVGFTGGINLADERTTGKISWDILHPEYQGRSLGTRLLGFRIEKLGSLGGIRRITVRTSQLAFGFYRKQGFVLKEVKKDYWAEGFDLYAMEYGGWK